MLMMCVMCTMPVTERVCVDDVCDVYYACYRVCVLMMCVMCTMPVTERVCVDDVCDVYYACYRACVC